MVHFYGRVSKMHSAGTCFAARLFPQQTRVMLAVMKSGVLPRSSSTVAASSAYGIAFRLIAAAIPPRNLTNWSSAYRMRVHGYRGRPGYGRQESGYGRIRDYQTV